MTDAEHLREVTERAIYGHEQDKAFLLSIADRIDWRTEPPDKEGDWLNGPSHEVVRFSEGEITRATWPDWAVLNPGPWLYSPPLPEPKEKP